MVSDGAFDVSTMPAPRLTLRPAVRHDLDALEELEFDCFDSDRFSRRRWSYLLTHAHATTLVLEANDTESPKELGGYVMVLLRRASRRGLLYSFCVHPRWQRQGWGRRLLAAVEQSVQRQGVTTLWLSVHTANLAAQRLYRQQGYSPYAWEADVYEDGGDAWRMEKQLVLCRP